MVVLISWLCFLSRNLGRLAWWMPWLQTQVPTCHRCRWRGIRWKGWFLRVKGMRTSSVQHRNWPRPSKTTSPQLRMSKGIALSPRRPRSLVQKLQETQERRLDHFWFEPQGCTALSGLLIENTMISPPLVKQKKHSRHSLYLVKTVLTWGQCCIESLGRRFPVMVLDGTYGLELGTNLRAMWSTCHLGLGNLVCKRG